MLTKEDQDGRLILSKKRARFERAWRRIEAAAESGEPVEGNVIEVVKGGLIIDLGVRGFLPASLVDIRRVQNLDEYLGQKIECKVIELNRSRNNVVLSRRAVLEEERKEARQQILDRLQRGEVVEGTISNIVDFGAFVDLDGIDGLIHISELSWGHVNHPSEVLSIGDTVRGQGARHRPRPPAHLAGPQADAGGSVGAGRSAPTTSGDVLEGKVTKVVSFGAFVEIMEGVEGLVHISELAQHHVENPREVVDPGDEVKVKILEIDDERRRLSLSLKRVEGQVLPMREMRAAAGDERAAEERRGEVPDLDLSEEVFARRRGRRRRRAGARGAGAEQPEAAAEPGRRGRRSRGQSSRPRPAGRARSPPQSRAPSRAASGRAAAGEAERARPRIAVHRLDRRHRLRQVRGAGRLRRRARRCFRATRSCTSCSGPTRYGPARGPLGDAVRRGRRGRPSVPWPRSCSSKPDELALARAGPLPAGRRADRGVAGELERGATADGRGGRGAAAVRGRHREAFDATVAVVADEDELRRRAEDRDHRGLDGRTARQLSQEEKAERADFVINNDGTLADLERRTEEILDALRQRAAR